MGLLDGKIVLIGGGSSSMGEATAELFAKEGAKGIGIHYSSSHEKVEKIINNIKKDTEAIPLQADISKYIEVKGIIDKMIKKWKKIDIIINYAGAPASLETWNKKLPDISDKEFLDPFVTDFLGSVHFYQASVAHMKNNGGGKIIFTSSSPTINGDEEGFSFTVAKDAIRLMVKSFAPIALKEYGVYLHIIAPGTTDTESNRKNYTKKQWDDMVKQIPLKRAVKSEEIAKVASFLSSELSNGIVGQTIIVDGGEIRI
jgi:NAD(P)-dependent dehydrogenase (short-subunit alcohol dehydrogenase family)